MKSNPSASITNVQPYVLILYRLAKWSAVAGLTFLYIMSYSWNPIFMALMVFCFAYCLAGLVAFLIHFLIYVFSKPVTLPEIRTALPDDLRVAFFRPIFAGSIPEMETVLNSMRTDIVNHKDIRKHLKFIVIDNTRSDEVKNWTHEEIKKMQKEFGDDTVYYFHRNVKCDFFKKVGIYQDAIMFLYEGWTRPGHYTDPKWDKWAKGTRNPNEPLWDVILGDLSALGVEGTLEDVLAGREIKIDENKRISLSIVCDADNVWPAGSIRKLLSKMIHPDNSRITIYQPSIEVVNPNENCFIKLTDIGRHMYGFDPVAKWRLFRFSPFFGKGAMKIDNYVDEIVKAEALHPGKAASHDFQEALFAWSVLVEDIFIWEKCFSNKLSELTRGTMWQRGDLETVEQYLFKKCEAGRKTHLWVLLRNVIGAPLYAIWVLGTILAWQIPALALMIHTKTLLVLFTAIAATGIVVPKFIAFYIIPRKERGHVVDPSLKPLPVGKMIGFGVGEAVLSWLANTLDLVYRTKAAVQNFLKIVLNIEYVWKTGAMGEMETSNMSLLQVYRTLWLSTAIGAVMLVLTLTPWFAWYAKLFMAHVMIPFLLGPAVIWLTAKPLPKELYIDLA